MVSCNCYEMSNVILICIGRWKMGKYTKMADVAVVF